MTGFSFEWTWRAAGDTGERGIKFQSFLCGLVPHGQQTWQLDRVLERSALTPVKGRVSLPWRSAMQGSANHVVIETWSAFRDFVDSGIDSVTPDSFVVVKQTAAGAGEA